MRQRSISDFILESFLNGTLSPRQSRSLEKALKELLNKKK